MCRFRGTRRVQLILALGHFLSGRGELLHQFRQVRLVRPFAHPPLPEKRVLNGTQTRRACTRTRVSSGTCASERHTSAHARGTFDMRVRKHGGGHQSKGDVYLSPIVASVIHLSRYDIHI